MDYKVIGHYMSDKVYKYFDSKEAANDFLGGRVILRTSFFYEVLESTGDTSTGDAYERTRAGYTSSEGASTSKSFVPKYISCFSKSMAWKASNFWVEVDSSEQLYKKIHEKLLIQYPLDTLLIRKLAFGGVRYLDPHEIHKFNLEEQNRKSIQCSEIKRKAYAVQEEWRIVFEAVGKQGKSLGNVMSIKQDSPLGKLLFNPETKYKIEQGGFVTYQEYLDGFREIIVEVGSLNQIARLVCPSV
ncbi:hypothetical protein K2P97_13075 [bacterium]|nr:hypothetical protein [bacterium]